MKRMKVTLSLAFLWVTISAFAQMDNSFKLPEVWDKDFIITLSYRGSMSGGKTEIRFTYDSCIYDSQSHHSKKPTHGTYRLKESDRVAILKKLHELKADQIKSTHSIYPVRDGWSQSICFNNHCIEGGTSAEMNEEHKNQFLTAYQFLEEYAMNKKARTAKR